MLHNKILTVVRVPMLDPGQFLSTGDNQKAIALHHTLDQIMWLS